MGVLEAMSVRLLQEIVAPLSQEAFKPTPFLHLSGMKFVSLHLHCHLDAKRIASDGVWILQSIPQEENLMLPCWRTVFLALEFSE